MFEWDLRNKLALCWNLFRKDRSVHLCVERRSSRRLYFILFRFNCSRFWSPELHCGAMATYTKIPSLNTTNPIGFFNSFIAVVGSLGCSHALHSPSGHIDDIPDLKIAHGIDAEKYFDQDHKDHGSYACPLVYCFVFCLYTWVLHIVLDVWTCTTHTWAYTYGSVRIDVRMRSEK